MGAGQKKYGRHKLHCLKYKTEGRREKNKARKAKKVAKTFAKKVIKKINRLNKSK